MLEKCFTASRRCYLVLCASYLVFNQGLARSVRWRFGVRVIFEIFFVTDAVFCWCCDLWIECDLVIFLFILYRENFLGFFIKIFKFKFFSIKFFFLKKKTIKNRYDFDAKIIFYYLPNEFFFRIFLSCKLFLRR